ncbi:acid phosphatase PHOa [Aspergillus steynii IBT 23096]|uniref:Acid phosphatase n=1 Tax=Aspergillus steynii IBT 23096 TaxID=1392250 RepID=A0A2I2G1I6_9EURO|nr:acid phosphatase PHOa [Aspergillus steynii IBT 23096]PLB46755.1 acid phosphatase PHOa [Aspergillus steynii IBT 23096]
MKSVVTALLAASVAYARTGTEKKPSQSEIEAAAASTEPHSPVSNVKGLAFDRFVQVWLENIDYEDAEEDENKQWLASQGITLTNFYATTHPSEPNYCAAAGGDTFGMDNDDYNQIPSNVSTIADLLDTKQIAWGEYQEHMPYPGFQGNDYKNQETKANDYVRKHNPLVLYDSVTENSTRLRQIKNFTHFDDDLENKKLPQWAFVTPNMTNDAHDTNITFAAKWERNWMTPLLKNSYFMDNTLVLLTFDEDNTYTKGNRIFSILLGGAIPDNLKGTKDDTFYTHYSVIATMSANWGLPSLGRWDCGANLLEIVANKTGYVNYNVDTTHLHLNETYPGPMSNGDYSEYSPEWPIPLTEGECSAGHGILDIVKETYKGTKPTFNYTSPFPYDTKSGYNEDVTATRKASLNGRSSAISASPESTANAGSSLTLPLIGSATGIFMEFVLGQF